MNSATTAPETLHLRTELLAARSELARLTKELETERAISARFQQDRDAAILESARIAATVAARRRSPQHVQLSHYLGDYTSEFVDGKTAAERAALRGGIHATTQTIWNSGLGLSWEKTIVVIRAMMAAHGFVFRDPGEGTATWDGYAMAVKNVAVAEQLDRVVRTHRTDLGAVSWYLNELTAVMYRVERYLEANR